MTCNVINFPNSAVRTTRVLNTATCLATAFSSYWELTLHCHGGYIPTIVAAESDEPELKRAKATLERALRGDGFRIYTGSNA